MKTNTMGIMAIVMMAAMVAPAFADTTTLNTNWNGAGILDMNFTAGNDLSERFTTGGNLISGNFQATDFNNNPYGYSVDSVNSYVTAKVTGGYATYQADRTDFATHPGNGENSTVPYMYGTAGQQLYAFVQASPDGSAEMAIGTQNNYASLQAGTYGMPHTTNGKNFEANASSFIIQEQILDGNGDGANFNLIGSGSAKIDSMSSEMGGSSFNFGKGLGCYTNADLDATGTGSFNVNAWADNGLNIDKGTIVIPGGGVDNGATYNLQIGYNGHFVYDNFALGGN